MDEWIKILTDAAFLDPRTKDWLFVDYPKTTIGLLVFYITWAKILGPIYMQNKKPYDLKFIVNLYNAFQIIVCGYLCIKLAAQGILDENILNCKAVDFSPNADALNMAKLVWLSFIVKGVDFIETIFFTFRKKWNQISFLHLYHHVVTFIVMWMAARSHPGGYYAQILCVNNFVHFVMYSYYLYSANASIQNRIRFVAIKKVVTLIQLVQFTLFICWGTQSFLVERCSSERNVSILLVPYNISLFYLFTKFYITSYHAKVKKS